MAKQIYALGFQAKTASDSDLLHKVGRKLENCATFVGMREVPTGESFRIGANYCKCKACAVCSYLVSMKRKLAILDYFDSHPEALRGKHVYHMVFTLRHSESVRMGDYSDELKAHFKQLRDSRATREYWKDHVEGGFYSMEVIGNQSGRTSDRSLHIHLHVILVSPTNLDKTGFAATIQARWQAITRDSNQVFLERVYRLQPTGKKEYYFPSSDPKILKEAFAESVKYTLKLDFNYQGITPETLASLLQPHKRFFGFFGSLYGKGIATFTHKDLEQVEIKGEELFSPSTGEVFTPSQTRLYVTPFWNLKPKTVEHCPVYSLADRSQRFFVEDVGSLAETLSTLNATRFSTELHRAKIAAWEAEHVSSDQRLFNHQARQNQVRGRSPNRISLPPIPNCRANQPPAFNQNLRTI